MAEYLVSDAELTEIADKLRDKDGSSAPIPFSDFADKIDPLADVSGVTASPADVASGKYFVDADGALQEGYLPVFGAYDVSFNPDAILTSNGRVTFVLPVDGICSSIYTEQQWLALVLGIIDNPTQTTSAKIKTGYTVLGIQGIG